MKDKLPKVYVKQETAKKIEDTKITIEKKINKILNTKKHIYKIPVKIKTKASEEEIITKIIGKNRTNIITIDNKIIEIKQIEDIEIYEN